MWCPTMMMAKKRYFAQLLHHKMLLSSLLWRRKSKNINAKEHHTEDWNENSIMIWMKISNKPFIHHIESFFVEFLFAISIKRLNLLLTANPFKEEKVEQKTREREIEGETLKKKRALRVLHRAQQMKTLPNNNDS